MLEEVVDRELANQLKCLTPQMLRDAQLDARARVVLEIGSIPKLGNKKRSGKRMHLYESVSSLRQSGGDGLRDGVWFAEVFHQLVWRKRWKKSDPSK